jgi:ubiquinone/menaquinone biosynthesis C-methylase UbiE
VAPYYESWKWFCFWRTYEAPFVNRWLGELPKGLGLDAGTGSGIYLPAMLAAGHRCVALDASSNMLNLARKRAASLGKEQEKVSFIEGHVTQLPLANECFDWILCTRVLSHVDRVDLALGEFNRVLRPNGECLICDVHPDHPYENVTVPTDEGRVEIETYKHCLDSLQREASAWDLRTLSLCEFRTKDLVPPPDPVKFAKILYAGELPIFYVWRMQKLGSASDRDPGMS